MAVSVRGYAQVFSTSTSTVITIPATTQAGDILVLQAVGGWTPTVPAGWTSDYTSFGGANVRAFVAHKTAVGGDAGSNVTVSWSSSYNNVVNLIVIAGSTGLRSVGQHAWSSTGGTATPDQQSGANGDMVIYLGGNRQDGGPPTLSRGTVDVSASDGSTVAAGVIGHELLTSDSLISCTFTAPSNGSGYEYSVLVAADTGTLPSYGVIEAAYVETLTASATPAQIEANYIEALTTTTPPAQVEANFIEVLTASAKAQIETVYAEALAKGTPYAQIASVYAEAIANGTPYGQIEAVYAEALISSPRMQTELVYAETLASGNPNLQTESVYAEVLGAGPPALQAENVYAEVLVSMTLFPNKRGWGITSI